MGPAIGSAGVRYTRGTNVVDIRSFGASPKADGRTNRLAIQAAMDAASKSDTRNRFGVYIPSGTYGIDRSVYINGTGMDIFGDGKGCSMLTGTCTMLHLGEKKAQISADDGVLVDSYGVLDSSAAGSPGAKYGLDVSKFRLLDQCGPMFRNGDLPWREMRQFTVDLVVDLRDVTVDSRTGLCGWENSGGEVSGEPWFIEQQRNGSDNYMVFWISLAKRPPYESAWTALLTPPSPDPIVRYTVQVDLDGHDGGTGPVVIMFCNGKQVAPIGTLPKPGGQFLDNFLRMFTVGPASRQGNVPAKIHGLRVQKGLRYRNDGPGSAQAYVSGGTINDMSQYFATGPEVLFQVPFDARPADLVEHPSMRVLGGFAGWEYVPLSPRNQQNEFMPFGLVSSSLSDFGLQGNYYGAGMLINGTANCQFHDLSIRWFNAALSFYGGVTYSNYFRDLDLEAVTSILALRSAYLQSFSRINSGLSGPRVFVCADNASQLAIEDWLLSPSTATSHYVYSDGASVFLRRFWADNEGFDLQGSCEYYFGALGSVSGVKVDIEWIEEGVGSYRKPVILLGGASSRRIGEVFQYPSYFSFKSTAICPERTQPARIQVDSPFWHAKLRNDAVYERGPFVLDNTLNGDSRVKVEDEWYNGPPRSSLWRKGMATLNPPDAVSGRPVEYACSQSGAYGTATPPRWVATKVLDDDESRLAADLVGHSYWSAGAAAATTIFGYWSDAVQVQNMDWIFQQLAPSIPALPTSLSAGLTLTGALRSKIGGEIGANLGYSRQPVTFKFPEAGRAEASAVSFGPATGDWGDGGHTGVPSAVVIVDESGNLIASADIDPKPVKSGDSGVSIGAGAVFMQHQPVAGSAFSPAVEDALTKAWLGGSQLPVWNLYLAVSTGEADVASGPVEPADTAYQRVAAPPACWTSTTGTRNNGGRYYPDGIQESVTQYEIAVVTNKQEMEFAKPTTDWGTVRSVYLMDAPTGGNVVAAANLVLPRTVKAGGAAPGFEIGAIRAVRS